MIVEQCDMPKNPFSQWIQVHEHLEGQTDALLSNCRCAGTYRRLGSHIVAGWRDGSVVITSSLAALRPNGNIAHYSAAKAGLVCFMRVVA
ncbi:SDR family NAD(P)-dependent oxidoreductase [Rhodococcus sp. IEGM 1305]|uniref:SDR family NAD(P)-dependent oxidoreductase n=1 Tax=Rhodococcus sp. IEGM 1305 TaxID=3047092 RepID=UPI0024B7216B|nr:SDR family NAD(P)-dependent oxidoreductase [Rhodococcus sp. IEGM 1305]MDI9953630.1 SDR family NAD(P)-dependent oxidoreductase [Rhodococcus sp. IEGM 1305]